jgi:membrane-associated protease RseP (regulator of RpoE activity)
MWLLGVAILVVGVAVSIGLHELGHFLPAKRFGVYVGSFFIGFGPTVWSRRGRETEFGFKAIPLGGYVSLSGMYPPTPNANSRGFRLFRKLVQEAREASADTIVDERRVFYRLPVLKRIVIMLGGPFANLFIATVLYLLMFCGLGIPAPTTTIGVVAECVKPVGATSQACTAADPVAPAATAGFRVGDRVLALNGVPVASWDSSMNTIRDNANVPITVVVDRAGARKSITVTPVLNLRTKLDASGNPVLDASGKPVTQRVGYIGIGPKWERQAQSPAVAFTAIGSNLAQTGGLILDLPNRMVQVWNAAFGTEQRSADGPISVVGVGRLAGDVASASVLDIGDRLQILLGILASLNIALFVFNLLPLLPLDGGHVVVALFEAARNAIARVRGKPRPGPVDSARLVPFTVVMTAVLFAMSALLIYADIVKPITLPL